MAGIKRALISVSDKSGVVDMAKGLEALGAEIRSTGGTAKALREAGVTVTDVAAYTGSPALWAADVSPEGFSWIDADDAARNTFSFLRRGGDGSDVVCVANFSAVPHGDLRMGLPSAGTWEEILNTDAATYTGSGVGNLGAVEAVAEAHQGQPASATIVVPPLATIYLRKA